MITEVSSPADVVPVLNEVEYVLETNNRITTPGSKFTSTITFLVLPVDGEVWVLTFNSIIVTIIYKTVALAANEVTIQASIADTVMETLVVAKNQYPLYANYEMNTAGVDFEITARQPGALWDIDFTGTTISTGAFPSNGVDEIRQDGFRIQVDLWKYTQTVLNEDFYSLVNSEQYEPDKAEQLVFDASALLLSMLDYDLPSFNQTAPGMCSKVFKKFKISYGEYYSDSVQNYAHSSQKRALLAALPEAIIPGNTFFADHFTAATNQLFLTACPRGGIKTNKSAQQFLYYYQRTDFATAYAVLYIEYTDGTSSVEDQLFVLGQPGDIIILPTGYTQLDVDALKTIGKTVKRWGMQVGANGLNYQDYTDYTEIFWYTLDAKPYQNNRYFLFANTYGGFDTLWCNGDVEFSNVTDSETYNTHKGGDTTTLIGATQRNTFGLRQAPRKISTGYIGRDYLEYITAQLLFTTVIYEIVNGQFRAIILDKSSIKDTHSTSDGKFQLKFGYKYAQEDKA
ncbi:hypothetical protein QQ054_32200 [Oscillatoria amoena NRMC-F 0135]|nr:hypothetical protein [Oscillatoria amoena NRMC-F 0135]